MSLRADCASRGTTATGPALEEVLLVWLAAQRGVGRGEGSSGLGFDLLVSC